MLLRDLHDLHGRLVREGLTLPDGFKRSGVHLVVDLSSTGEVRSAVSTPDERGRPLPRVIPDLPRTSAVEPLLIADKLGYVAGFAAPGKHERARAQWAAYRALLDECRAAVSSPRLAERIDAVKRATSDPVRFVDALNRHLLREDTQLDRRGVCPTENETTAAEAKRLAEQAQWFVDFMVEGEGFFPSILHDHGGDPDLVSWWSERVTAQSTSGRIGTCQVTEVRAPLARLFPAVGELPGNSPRLVSCNFDAAQRYGADQANGAAVSTVVASSATQALKWLAGEMRETHRWDLGELVLVWWCPDDLTLNPLEILQQQPDPLEVRDLLSSTLWSGRPNVTEHSEFHLAVLTVNSARIVVRADHTTRLDELQERLRSWFRGLDPVRDRDRWAGLGIPELAAAACPPGRAQAAQRARVATDLVRRAVLGERLPLSLRDRVVRRCRVGVVDSRGRRQHVTAAQAALLHAIARSLKEDWMTGTQAELCGRLLAVLETTQQRALGFDLNRGVQDSYGAASTAPRLVFPRLLTRRGAHVKRMRRDRSKRGSIVYLDQQTMQVMAELHTAGGFPAQLDPEGQAQFALGYWHQRHEMQKRSPAQTEGDDEATHPATNDGDLDHDLETTDD